MDFVSKCTEILNRRAFTGFGFAKLERPLSMDFYRQWLAKGYQADMKYLETHVELKEHPTQLAPKAKAAIVVTKQYFPHPYPSGKGPKGLRTALYAQGEDYHFRLKAELEETASELRSVFSNHEFLCFTDSMPVLERDLAYRASLGWFGKNTCLIDKQKGSLFLLGQIFTSLPLTSQSPPMPDLCGTCDRCIQACPTGAIEAPRTLNAGKCIAYWTIEARTTAPLGIREKIGDWFFGCDVCQTVCPWNEKSFGRETMRSLSASSGSADHEDLRWILRSSRKELSRVFAQSPLSRARPQGLKRNALVVIGNLRIRELRQDVEACLNIPDLKEVAEWAMAQLG